METIDYRRGRGHGDGFVLRWGGGLHRPEQALDSLTPIAPVIKNVRYGSAVMNRFSKDDERQTDCRPRQFQTAKRGS